jgi:hypothetical protein
LGLARLLTLPRATAATLSATTPDKSRLFNKALAHLFGCINA